MKLPVRHRHLFKDPMGLLIADSDVTKKLVSKELDGFCHIVTVGDRTTERILGFELKPDVQIVDGLEQRQKRSVPGEFLETITCINPAANITDDAVSAVIKAYSMKRPTRILVNGEEDLLVVPALLHAPKDTIVLYGQPGQGLVFVVADNTSRNRAAHMMELLERDDETVAE